MANHGRKFARALALAALCLLLGGCAMNVSTDKLYALPSLPAEYASLEAEINALLSDGAEHAAPTSRAVTSRVCRWSISTATA